MEVREYTTAEGDYVVEIKCSTKDGDSTRMFQRNANPNDVPLVIVYNVGPDFRRRADQEQRARSRVILQILRVAVTEVVEEIGRLVGVQPPKTLVEETRGVRARPRIQ